MSAIKNKNEQTIKQSNAVSPWFLLVLIAITSTILAIFLQNSLSLFVTHDADPSVISVTPQKIIEFGGMPVDVEVGMSIYNFPEFNMVKGIFVVDAIIWFRFNPELVSLARIKQFKFEKASVIKKEELKLRIDGLLALVSFDMRIKFDASLRYDNFPLDDHRINFVLSNFHLSASDIMFHSGRSDFVISPEAKKTAGWHYVDRQVRVGYAEDSVDKINHKTVYRPRAVFSIDYERAGSRYLISILLPLLLIFFIALFSFSFNLFTTSTYSIVAMSSGAITALIAYRFVIENMSPAVGYFMITDYIFIYFLIATCIILACNIFGTYVNAHVRRVVAILLHVSTIALIVYLLNPWN